MEDVKITILDRVIEEITAQIETAKRGRLFAIEESKAHKGAMESRYDTFKEEAQYLAGGQNARLLDLGKVLGMLRSLKNNSPTVTRGSGYAIIEAKNLDDGSRVKYFLLPAGGGNIYEVAGEKISVLNVAAPLARAFIGTIAGDEVEVEIQGKRKRFNVISIT